MNSRKAIFSGPWYRLLYYVLASGHGIGSWYNKNWPSIVPRRHRFFSSHPVTRDEVIHKVEQGFELPVLVELG